MTDSQDFRTTESSRLEEIAQWFRLGKGMYGNTTRWTATELIKLARGRSCLELGSADGEMTVILEKYFDHIVSVDGSQEYVLRTKARVTPKTQVIQAMFEELELAEQFDTIIISHVLEHVADPVNIMDRAKHWIAPGGALLVVVPNADSLHRKAAVYMGLLKRCDELNEMDKRLGHRRVYSPITLCADIEKAGLCVGRTGGIFLKVLSNAQLEATWTDEMIAAYYQLGFEFPQNCAEIWVECLLPS